MNRFEWRYGLKDDDLGGDVVADQNELALDLVLVVGVRPCRLKAIAKLYFMGDHSCPDTGYVDEHWVGTCGQHSFHGDLDEVMARAIEHARRNPILADLPVVEPKEVAA